MLVGAVATDVCLALLKLAVALRGHLVFHVTQTILAQPGPASRLPLLWAHLIESDIEAERVPFLL